MTGECGGRSLGERILLTPWLLMSGRSVLAWVVDWRTRITHWTEASLYNRWRITGREVERVVPRWQLLLVLTAYKHKQKCWRTDANDGLFTLCLEHYYYYRCPDTVYTRVVFRHTGTRSDTIDTVGTLLVVIAPWEFVLHSRVERKGNWLVPARCIDFF